MRGSGGSYVGGSAGSDVCHAEAHAEADRSVLSRGRGGKPGRVGGSMFKAHMNDERRRACDEAAVLRNGLDKERDGPQCEPSPSCQIRNYRRKARGENIMASSTIGNRPVRFCTIFP